MIKYEIIDDFTDTAPTEELLESLPQWRREQALRFKQEQGRKECALSYLLLEKMLGWQPEFVLGEHGKPYVKPPFRDEKIFFNLSHCKAAIACVVGDGEVGIDVERIGRYNERIARYCMSDEEVEQIVNAENSDAEFTMLWTKKEALLKLTGEGITDDMKTCLVSDRMNGVSIESVFNEEKGYAYSVAYYTNK